MAIEEVVKSLRCINLNDKLDTKPVGKKGQTLRYLPWSVAWDEILKRYPDATYEVVTFDTDGNRKENALPYQKTALGYLVWTRVTIEGVTREMWLPVMDAGNNPLMDSPYTITNRWGDQTEIGPISITAVNRSIMRCLVKTLAMFGLGLYIYTKDDSPSDDLDVDDATGEVIESDPAVQPPTLEAAYTKEVTIGKSTFPMGDLVAKATDPDKAKRILDRLAHGKGDDAAAAKVILDALANGAVHFPSAQGQA